MNNHLYLESMPTTTKYFILAAIISMAAFSSGSIISSAFGAEAPEASLFLQQECKGNLDEENQIAKCMGGASGWRLCTAGPPILECCDHAHKAFTYKDCDPAGSTTNKICDDGKTVKPVMVESNCIFDGATNTWDCVPEQSATCDVPAHWETEYALEDCIPEE